MSCIVCNGNLLGVACNTVALCNKIMIACFQLPLNKETIPRNQIFCFITTASLLASSFAVSVCDKYDLFAVRVSDKYDVFTTKRSALTLVKGNNP